MIHDFDELKFHIPDDYDSPLRIVTQAAENYAKFIDDGVMKAVAKVGFDIDKDKLVSVLQQDKSRYSDAYKKGYTDGYLKREDEIVRCKDCKWLKWADVDDETVFCRLSERCRDMNWFCADGEKKDE